MTKIDNTTRYERLRERYRNGDLDRRSFLGLLGAAGAAYGLVTPYRALKRSPGHCCHCCDFWSEDSSRPTGH